MRRTESWWSEISYRCLPKYYRIRCGRGIPKAARLGGGRRIAGVSAFNAVFYAGVLYLFGFVSEFVFEETTIINKQDTK
jgi:hypothetical protein